MRRRRCARCWRFRLRSEWRECSPRCSQRRASCAAAARSRRAPPSHRRAATRCPRILPAPGARPVPAPSAASTSNHHRASSAAIARSSDDLPQDCRIPTHRLDDDAALGAEGWSIARTVEGERFVAAIERGAVLGCQFHPELSGAYGEALLQRWLERAALACAGGVA